MIENKLILERLAELIFWRWLYYLNWIADSTKFSLEFHIFREVLIKRNSEIHIVDHKDLR